MTTSLKISAAVETELGYFEHPWLIVNDGTIIEIFETQADARKAKAKDNIVGKIVDSEKCEFEVVETEQVTDVAEQTPADKLAFLTALAADEAANPPDNGDDAPCSDEPVDHFDTVTEEQHTFHRGEVKQTRKHSETQSNSIKTTLKLKRACVCVENGVAWERVGDIHKLNPQLMTWSQCGALRLKLYNAAKEGKLIDVKVGDYTYRLLEV